MGLSWSALTTPPPARLPSPKAPLFTTKFFSTKSLGPGHLVGAGILVVGIVGLVKLFAGQRPQEQVATDDDRGQYGKRP